MRRRRQSPLPKRRTAPAFLLFVSTSAPLTTTGSGFAVASSAEDPSFVRGSSGNSRHDSGTTGNVVRLGGRCRRGGRPPSPDEDGFYFCGARGRDDAAVFERKCGSTLQRRSREGGGVLSAVEAFVAHRLPLPRAVAATGSAFLGRRAVEHFSRSSDRDTSRGPGFMRDRAIHGGWGSRIKFIGDRVKGEDVASSRCAGRNSRPNSAAASSPNANPGSVPSAANTEPNPKMDGVQSGDEEIRRRRSEKSSTRSSMENTEPGSVAYSALCPALDGERGLAFVSITPPLNPASIRPRIRPAPAPLSLPETPRGRGENAAQRVTGDETQRRGRGGSERGERVSLAPEQRGTPGSALDREETDSGTFGVGVVAGSSEDVAAASTAWATSVVTGGASGVSGGPPRLSTAGNVEGTVSVDDTLGGARRVRRSRRRGGRGDRGGAKGVRIDREGASGDKKSQQLREILGDAVKTGRGGAALRALRLMVGNKQPVTEKQFVGAMEACMRQVQYRVNAPSPPCECQKELGTPFLLVCAGETRIGSWTSGLEVFRLLLEDVRPRGRSPSKGAWKSLARGLRSAGQADQALVLLSQALRGGVDGIDEQVCSILLDLCAIKGRMGLAEEIASLMDVHGIQKGPVTFCVLLKGYGRQRRLSEVKAVMREMRSRRVVPDVVALNAAVDAFVRCGELSKAKRILKAMENSPGGSIAQTLTYNTIIKGLGRELLLEEAFDVARSMVERGCSPNEVTRNSLVDICVRSGEVDRAYNLLKNPDLVLAPASPRPPLREELDDKTTSAEQWKGEATIIRAGTVEGRVGGSGAEGVAIAQELETGNGDAVVVTGEEDKGGDAEQENGDDVEGLLSLLTDRQGDNEGFRAGSASVKRPTAGSAATVAKADPNADARGDASLPSASLIDSVADEEKASVTGRSDDAGERAASRSRGSGRVLPRPSVEAFTSVLTGFAGVGDKDRALAVFQQMVNAGVEPNVVTYTGLISACVNSGDMDGAKRLFAALESQARGSTSSAMQPSAFTYNTIISGLCRMKDALNQTPQGEDSAEEVDRGGEEPNLIFFQDSAFRRKQYLPPAVSAVREKTTGAGTGSGDLADLGKRTEPSIFPPVEGSTFAEVSGERSTVFDTGREGSAQREAEMAAFDPDVLGGEGVEGGDIGGAASPPVALVGGESSAGRGSDSGSRRGPLPQGIQEALQVLLSMRRRGVSADEITMNSLLDGLVSCSPPRMREAEAVMTLMTGWGIKPNQVSYTVMLKGYGRAGDLGGAELMFELMANDRDQRPDVVALNSLLDACVRNSDLRRAVEILDQAINTALAGKADVLSHEQWALSSSSRRSWGMNAGAGSLAVSMAATQQAPASGVGELKSDGDGTLVPRNERPAEVASSGSAGERWGRRRSRGIAIEVRPNQVSFATVVLGLSRRGDADAGRKAIALYRRMRRDFGFIPDEGMVDGLMAACWNAQAGETDDNDTALAQGKEALNELGDLGWEAQLIAAKEQMLRRVVPTLSEVWKEDDEATRDGSVGGVAPAGSTKSRRPRSSSRTGEKKDTAGTNRKRKASAEIFEKYGWNRMDSHFPVL